MGGQDTEESRERATAKAALEITSQLKLSDELKEKVKPDTNPIEVTSELIKKYMAKFINAVFDTQGTPEEIPVKFVAKTKQVLRRAIGEIVDSLKDCFNDGLPDALRFLRENIRETLDSQAGFAGSDMILNIGVDKFMGLITNSYSQYQEENALRQREQAEREAEEEKKEEVEDDEEMPELEEEEVKEQTEEEKMLEEMEDDATLLECDEDLLPDAPMSSAYNVTDLFNPTNINSKTPCTKRKITTTAKQEMTLRLKKALRDGGLPSDKVEKLMGDKEIPDDLVNSYKGLLLAMMKDKKESPDFEEGRYPGLDKLE